MMAGRKGRENAVSEKEKDLIKKMAKGVSSLDDNQKNYVLGLVEGMALAKGENENQQTDNNRAVISPPGKEDK